VSGGLRFRKIDLHTHTPASRCFLDKSITPEQFVKAAIIAGLDGIAITDHNSGENIDKIKEAASGTTLTIFPGVEISVAGGIHVVALFDTDRGTDHVKALLGSLGIFPENYGKPETLTTEGIHIVIEKILKSGGLPILAHIDSPSGAFYELAEKGSSRLALFNDGQYSAVETLEGELPSTFNRSYNYHRIPACYQSSDNPDPAQPQKHSIEGIGIRCSLFKIDDPINLEGLRQCFADPQVRIKKAGSPVTLRYPHILEVRASNGFLGRQRILFHPGLNSIIGGKGVGKSLMVELVRFALDQASDIDTIQDDHKKKLDKTLGELNYVNVKCQMPSGVIYEVKRTLGGSIEVTDTSMGAIIPCNIAELFPILAYSQMEIIKIAEDRNAQLKLVDGFIESKVYQSRIEELNNKLDDNDKKISESIIALNNLEKLMQDIGTTVNRILEINRNISLNEDYTSLVKDFNQIEKKKTIFEQQYNFLNDIKNRLFTEKELFEGINPPCIDIDDDDTSWTNEQCSISIKGVISNINKEIVRIDGIINNVKERIDIWIPIFYSKEAIYNENVTKKEEDRILEINRKNLNKRLQQIETEYDDIATCASKLYELFQRRYLLMHQLSEIIDKYFSERKRIFDDLSTKSAGRLKLNLHHLSNKKKFQEILKSTLRGTNIRSGDFESIANNLGPSEFLRIILNKDYYDLKTKANITGAAAQKIIDRILSEESLEPYLSMEHRCYPEDVPDIQYKKDGGSFAPLDELSVGQKCTALLIIALSEGTVPVIIDQPEDALDITTVWQDISMKLRQSKDQRQFILTTHNASVGVASDSDMFIEVKSTAVKATVNCWGGIEDIHAREAVIKHLEGGVEPYQLRLSKYNLNR